jgi:ketosteroid isomerase-like protein
MSQENVEVVRSAFEAWNAADMERFYGLLDADVILRAPKDWPEPGPFVGREAVVREYEELRGAWDADSLTPISDFIDAGNRVAVRYTWRGVGQGPTATMELTVVLTVRAQKLVAIDYFWDRSEALEAVGLRE